MQSWADENVSWASALNNVLNCGYIIFSNRGGPSFAELVLIGDFGFAIP